MDTPLNQRANQIDSVPSVDLGTQEKVLLTGRPKKKLLDFRMVWSADFERMIATVSKSAAAEKETYLRLMSEILARVRI